MLSWTVIVDVVVITALAPGDVERFAGAHPPHYRGAPPLTRPRPAMPFDQHPVPGLFAPLTLMQTNGVNNDAFLHRLFHLIHLV